MTKKESKYIKGYGMHLILMDIMQKKQIERRKFIDLAHHYGYARSTAVNILHALVYHGVLLYDEKTKIIKYNV